MSEASGAELGYRIEVRADHPFVAWDMQGYECAATPKAEFVIGPRWQTVPLTTLPEPLGVAPVNLPMSRLAAHDGLVCYETAKALQFALLARFKYRSAIEVRVTEVRYQYRYTTSEQSEPAMPSFLGPRFSAAPTIVTPAGDETGTGSAERSEVERGPEGEALKS